MVFPAAGVSDGPGGSETHLRVRGAHQTAMVEFLPARPSVRCCSSRGRTGPPRLHQSSQAAREDPLLWGRRLSRSVMMPQNHCAQQGRAALQRMETTSAEGLAAWSLWHPHRGCQAAVKRNTAAFQRLKPKVSKEHCQIIS